VTTDKIRKYIILYLPYAGMFWLFSKCGEAYRLSTESDTLRKIMDAIANLNTALSRPLPSLNPFDLCVGLAGAAAVFGIVWYKKKNAKKWRKDDVRCKGVRWTTTYKQGGHYVCGTNEGVWTHVHTLDKNKKHERSI
jgi:type IV secretion system protein VirD4